MPYIFQLFALGNRRLTATSPYSLPIRPRIAGEYPVPAAPVGFTAEAIWDGFATGAGFASGASAEFGPRTQADPRVVRHSWQAERARILDVVPRAAAYAALAGCMRRIIRPRRSGASDTDGQEVTFRQMFLPRSGFRLFDKGPATGRTRAPQGSMGKGRDGRIKARIEL